MIERKVYTDEFKREAVRLATERGNLAETARQLGLCDSVLARWKERLAAVSESEEVFPGSGNARDAEVAQLRRENARLQEENDILKKAVGIFTKAPR